jgi:hypothetical protein
MRPLHARRKRDQVTVLDRVLPRRFLACFFVPDTKDGTGASRDDIHPLVIYGVPVQDGALRVRGDATEVDAELGEPEMVPDRESEPFAGVIQNMRVRGQGGIGNVMGIELVRLERGRGRGGHGG